MTKRKKETLKKILERNIGDKVINIYNLNQKSTGETFNAIIEWNGITYDYEIFHEYKKRDVIIRNYNKLY